MTNPTTGLLVEFMKAGRVQAEKVCINSNGDMGTQFRNPNAAADYADYLARREHILHEEGEECDIEK